MVGRLKGWADLQRAVAVAALAVLLVAGSGFLWIGLPVLGFWLVGELTTTAEGFLLAALGSVPLAMVGFGWLLYRLNAAYERLRGRDAEAPSVRAAWLVSSSEERAPLRRARARRSLIDVAMTVSAAVALVLLVVWFLFSAETHLVTPP